MLVKRTNNVIIVTDYSVLTDLHVAYHFALRNFVAHTVITGVARCAKIDMVGPSVVTMKKSTVEKNKKSLFETVIFPHEFVSFFDPGKPIDYGFMIPCYFFFSGTKCRSK